MDLIQMVPPDGGFGWVVVFAYALNSIIMVPILQSFGLLFKDKFHELGFSATDSTTIITTNASFSMLTGLINGPLLKIFGYRKISYVSATFTVVGVLMTAFANSFIWLLITYGLITSLGMGMGMSSYPLAMNSFFTTRRNRAIGIAMTLTGLGPIFMPQLITILLKIYGTKGATIVIGALALNCFVAASLLQPLKWHLVAREPLKAESVVKEADAIIEEDFEDDEDNIGALITGDFKRYDSFVSIDHSIDHDMEIQTIYGYDTPLNGSMLSITNSMRQRKMSVSSYRRRPSVSLNKWASTTSLNKKHTRVPYNRTNSENNDIKYNTIRDHPYQEMTIVKEPEPGFFKRITITLVNLFDLDLLKDPIYVNIMIGTSLAVFAEMNFSLLTPFLLADYQLENIEIATFLSVLSIVDLSFRFFAPYIGEFCKQPPRIMYMGSLILLITTRYSLVIFRNYSQLLFVAGALGIAKGIRTVFMTLVIPSYVSIDKLANASGIQMIVNGVLILAGGPVLGVIRDLTGSYSNCIFILNSVTMLTIIIWSVELVYVKCKTKKKEEQFANIKLATV